MKSTFRLGLCIIASLTLGGSLKAQQFIFPSDIEAKLSDLDRQQSPGLFRRAYADDSVKSMGIATGVDLEILSASTDVSYNTDFPFGDNDGALWQGRGFSGIFRAGAGISWDWGSVRIEPEWWFAQNSEHDMALRAGHPTIGDYQVGLDRLQAYGSGFYQDLGFGQSELRLNRWGFTLGFGTENLKLGPAESQNIILSDNASGFPVLDIGTDGPIATKFGSFDARFFWGQTKASEWFDADTFTNKFLWCGGAISYSPPFLEEMSFGFIRVFHSPWSTVSGWKLIQFFDDTVWKKFRTAPGVVETGEDDVDQILSFTWEWRIPDTGSRAYLELARNDHSADIIDFIMQPEHSIGYTIGLEQKIALGETSRILLWFELSDLGKNIGTTIRPTGSWYRHTLVNNGGIDTGYAHDGQLIGASEGPGSNSQRFSAYYIGDGWFAGIGVMRELFDADYYYSVYSSEEDYIDYNLLLSCEVCGGISLGEIEIGGAVDYIYNWSRNFVIDNDCGNWRFQLSAKFSR